MLGQLLVLSPAPVPALYLSYQQLLNDALEQAPAALKFLGLFLNLEASTLIELSLVFSLTS